MPQNVLDAFVDTPLTTIADAVVEVLVTHGIHKSPIAQEELLRLVELKLRKL